MRNKYALTILILTFCMVSAGLMPSDFFSEVMATIKVTIEKDRDTDVWRVRDKEGNNRGTLKVGKKDKIYWQAKGSDMRFTFSKPVDDYFTYSEGQFLDGKSQLIGRSKMLQLTVKSDAPPDTLIYEVYVAVADTLVVGNSPPKLIIK